MAETIPLGKPAVRSSTVNLANPQSDGPSFIGHRVYDSSVLRTCAVRAKCDHGYTTTVLWTKDERLLYIYTVVYCIRGRYNIIALLSRVHGRLTLETDASVAPLATSCHDVEFIDELRSGRQRHESTSQLGGRGVEGRDDSVAA